MSDDLVLTIVHILMSSSSSNLPIGPGQKRMTSVSVADLHDSVSNLSIRSRESGMKFPKTFESKYIKLDEIGRGGFSFVYRCKDRATETIYAVKIIDLRPLRLRDNFDPNRLRREVDIMKHLRHPNIVQFVEYFETPDEFFMILEYCPGKELFDVILARQKLSEPEAKPIFYQIANAVAYLHSLNIMHRDIKPENILVLDAVDPQTGQQRIKLLDFGLSKNAGNGSAGKSFVGTPCYLAPEVEYTSQGHGGVYGLSADCWSLGALLHVMLVARFPEFERDRRGTLTLVLPSRHWSEISVQAKDLVKNLMEPNAFSRLTIKEVLMHPWLGPYKTNIKNLPKPPALPPMSPIIEIHTSKSPQSSISEYNSTSDIKEFTQLYSLSDDMIMSLHDEFEEEKQQQVHDMSRVVVKVSPRNATNNGINNITNNNLAIEPVEKGQDASLSLGPLLNLQRSIALCFEDALSSYIEFPEVATQIHKGAVMCRKQLMDSTKMLRKVEQTASSVLELFPDLELAVEEGVPQLAAEFFSVVRGWVVELRETVTSTQQANHDSMLQIHAIIHESTVGLSKRQSSKEAAAEMKREIDKAEILNNIKRMQSIADSKGGLSTDEIFELFMTLFNSTLDTPVNLEPKSGEGDPSEQATPMEETDSSPEDKHSSRHSEPIIQEPLSTRDSLDSATAESKDGVLNYPNSKPPRSGEGEIEATSYNQVAVLGASSPSPPTANSPSAAKLLEALHKLRQVDMILEQLGVFWANTEVVLDVLAKKGQHAEQFVAFASNPRLLNRFKERLAEYSKFWMGVRDMCSSYVSNVQPQAETKIRLYEFLEKESSKDTSTMSEQLYGNTLLKRVSSSSRFVDVLDTPERYDTSNRIDKVDSI